MDAALKDLINRISTGWTVNITDHDRGNDGREAARVEVRDQGIIRMIPKAPWTSQGRSYPHMDIDFTNGGDWVADRNTVRLYRTPAPHTGKPRVLVRTFTFFPSTI